MSTYAVYTYAEYVCIVRGNGQCHQEGHAKPPFGPWL